MFSKRGKGKKNPNAKQSSRSSAPQGRSRGPRGKGQSKSNRFQQPNRSQSAISAPLNTGAIRQRMFGLSFDRAAPNDQFPEGGLRVVGLLPTNSGSLTELKDTSYGMFDGSGHATVGISPTADQVSSETEQLFPTASPLAVFAQYFRKFRFRRLHLDVTSEISPGVVLQSGGAGLIIQIAHEPDIVTAAQASTTYTIDTAVTSRNCTRFPAWTQNVVCPVITENKTSSADELYFCSGAGDAEIGTNQAAMRQTFQGAITAVGSIYNGTAPLVTSKVLVAFTVDLYGFTNIATGVLPKRKSEKKVERKIDSRQLDTELDPMPLLRRREPDFVEIDLTPKSQKADEKIPNSQLRRSLKG